MHAWSFWMNIGKRSNKITICKPKWHGLDNPLALTLLYSTPARQQIPLERSTRVRQKCAETGHRFDSLSWFLPRESITKDSKAELRGISRDYVLFTQSMLLIWLTKATRWVMVSDHVESADCGRKKRFKSSSAFRFQYPTTRVEVFIASYHLWRKKKRVLIFIISSAQFGIVSGVVPYIQLVHFIVLYACINTALGIRLKDLETIDRFIDIWAWKGKCDHHLHFSL